MRRKGHRALRTFGNPRGRRGGSTARANQGSDTVRRAVLRYARHFLLHVDIGDKGEENVRGELKVFQEKRDQTVLEKTGFFADDRISFK